MFSGALQRIEIKFNLSNRNENVEKFDCISLLVIIYERLHATRTYHSQSINARFGPSKSKNFSCVYVKIELLFHFD